MGSAAKEERRLRQPLMINRRIKKSRVDVSRLLYGESYDLLSKFEIKRARELGARIGAILLSISRMSGGFIDTSSSVEDIGGGRGRTSPRKGGLGFGIHSSIVWP